MGTAVVTEDGAPRRLGRSVGSILLGFVVVFVLSLGTDQILHVLQIYPPWGQPMYQPGLNLLALSYRLVYGVAGGWATARVAPHAPLRHALILGVAGLGLSSLGVLGAMSADLGPLWYPIALALSSVPTAWLGGRIYQRGGQRR